MKKILIFLLLASFVAAVDLEELNTKLEGQQLTGFPKTIFGNERINLHVDGQIIGMVVQNGVFGKLTKKLDTPTINAYTEQSVIDNIVASSDPLTSFTIALEQGKITYIPVSFMNKLKFGIISLFKDDTETLPPLPKVFSPTEIYFNTLVETSITNTKETENKISTTLLVENKGDKAVIIIPSIKEEKTPFLITRKAIPAEKGIVFGSNAPYYDLVKAKIQSSPITLAPGEKKEIPLEVIPPALGLPGKKITIILQSSGEIVKENEIPFSKPALVGTAFDHRQEQKTFDVYLVIPSSSKGQYRLELSINKQGWIQHTVFADVYGPYKISAGDGFVFAQQFIYDNLFNGKYIVKTSLFKDGKIIVENEFEMVTSQ